MREPRKNAGAFRVARRWLGFATPPASNALRAAAIAGRFFLAHSASAITGSRSVRPNFVSS